MVCSRWKINVKCLGTLEPLDTFGRARYDIFLVFRVATGGYCAKLWARESAVDDPIVNMHDQEMGAVEWYCLVLIVLYISTQSTALSRTYIYSSVPWSCLFECTNANQAAVADCFRPSSIVVVQK